MVCPLFRKTRRHHCGTRAASSKSFLCNRKSVLVQDRIALVLVPRRHSLRVKAPQHPMARWHRLHHHLPTLMLRPSNRHQRDMERLRTLQDSLHRKRPTLMRACSPRRQLCQQYLLTRRGTLLRHLNSRLRRSPQLRFQLGTHRLPRYRALSHHIAWHQHLRPLPARQCYRTSREHQVPWRTLRSTVRSPRVMSLAPMPSLVFQNAELVHQPTNPDSIALPPYLQLARLKRKKINQVQGLSVPRRHHRLRLLDRGIVPPQHPSQRAW